MKRISGILLIIFTLILILSMALNHFAQNKQIEKEENIFLLISRTQIVNKYYDLGAFNCYNGSRSMEDYKKYIEVETSPFVDKIKILTPSIKKYNFLANIFIYLAIIGHIIILFIECKK